MHQDRHGDVKSGGSLRSISRNHLDAMFCVAKMTSQTSRPSSISQYRLLCLVSRLSSGLPLLMLDHLGLHLMQNVIFLRVVLNLSAKLCYVHRSAHWNTLVLFVLRITWLIYEIGSNTSWQCDNVCVLYGCVLWVSFLIEVLSERREECCAVCHRFSQHASLTCLSVQTLWASHSPLNHWQISSLLWVYVTAYTPDSFCPGAVCASLICVYDAYYMYSTKSTNAFCFVFCFFMSLNRFVSLHNTD